MGVGTTSCSSSEPDPSNEVDLTRRDSVEFDPTCTLEVDPMRGGVGVDILNGELNSKQVTSVEGDSGGGSGDVHSSDPVSVRSRIDMLMSPECTLRVSVDGRAPHCAELRLFTGSNTGIGGVQTSFTLTSGVVTTL